jgi:hypothetical protein
VLVWRVVENCHGGEQETRGDSVSSGTGAPPQLKPESRGLWRICPRSVLTRYPQPWSEKSAEVGRGQSDWSMQLDCPACERPTFHRFLYAKNNCAIVKCSVCGLGRARCEEFDPREYYSSEYFSGGRADGYADYRGAPKLCCAVNFLIRSSCGQNRARAC